MAYNQGSKVSGSSYAAASYANDTYRRTTVSTASQGQLVVLLYEGAVKRLTAAADLFDEKGMVAAHNIEQLNDNLQKAQAIITELEVSLDMEAGGEIAHNLMALYVYFNSELMSANINRDKGRIDFVLKMMSELLESWRKAAASTANTYSAGATPALNIKG